MTPHAIEIRTDERGALDEVVAQNASVLYTQHETIAGRAEPT